MGRRAVLLQEVHGGVQETHGNRGTACLRKRCELDGVDELPAGKFHGSQEFAQFFGGTSLLILVGVILDTLAQIEARLNERNYDGFLESGRIMGRSTAAIY